MALLWAFPSWRPIVAVGSDQEFIMYYIYAYIELRLVLMYSKHIVQTVHWAPISCMGCLQTLLLSNVTWNDDIFSHVSLFVVVVVCCLQVILLCNISVLFLFLFLFFIFLFYRPWLWYGVYTFGVWVHIWIRIGNAMSISNTFILFFGWEVYVENTLM